MFTGMDGSAENRIWKEEARRADDSVSERARNAE